MTTVISKNDSKKTEPAPQKAERMVVHSNAIVEASYTLSLTEQRILLMAMSMIKKDDKITGKTPFLISSKDYADIFKVEMTHAYRDLIKAERNLFNRIVWLYEADDENGMEFTKTRWIQAVTYKKGQGEIVLYFSEKIIPYISGLSSAELTVAYLSEMATLTSFYAIRLYAILAQWRSVGRLSISVNEFRSRLELNGVAYNQISNLKNKVIDVAIKQINERTGMVVNCEYVKTKRTVTGIIFTFNDSRQLVGWGGEKKGRKKNPDMAQSKNSSSTMYQLDSYATFNLQTDPLKNEWISKFVNDVNVPSFYRFSFQKKGLAVLEDDQAFKDEFCKWMKFASTQI